MAQLEKIVYDPGAGQLADGDIFMGWTTEKAYTKDSLKTDIDGVRKALSNKTITEGDVINYYAMIASKVEVKYVAEGVVLNSISNLVYGDESIEVTVNTDYTPATEDEGFLGWIPDNASKANITSAKLNGRDVAGTENDPYAVGTVLTIKGSITLNAYAPQGHWLVFDENGKGATYHAPQFVKNGNVTTDPGEMTRNGYTFGGWYTDKDCTAGNEFTFSGALDDKTTIYAKWTAIDNAPYTVVIWKQNVDGQNYDFEVAIPLTGTTGTKVSPVTKRPSEDDAGADNSYAIINNKTYQWEGFHLGIYDTDVIVNPEGDAIVNVYFDRSEYTLTFMINEGYVETTDTYEQTPKQYYYEDSLFGGSYKELTYRNGKWQYRSWGRWHTYTGTRYKYIQGGTIKTITALYGQKIRDQFNPLIGNDGTKYNDSWNVDETPNGKFTVDTQLSFLDTMPADNTVFTYYTYPEGYTYTFNFYLENLPNQTGTYSLAHSYVTKAYGLTSTEDEDFINMEGFTKDHSDPAYINKRYEFNEYGDDKIDFYYKRNQHSIIYQDGACYGKETIPATKAILKQVDRVYYEQDLASYADSYTPTKEGYTFAGWYSDETCTVPYKFEGTMPDHNIVVYAKWQQNEYRVFLHPNVDSSDTSLDWGSDSQAMNFRVYDGEKVSLPTGIRDEYEMIGWYSDEACTKPYYEETRLNTTTVAAIGRNYDQTSHMTDPMDKYGNITGTGTNSDAKKGRTWITKEVNLYAKWRSKLLGANGIHVMYDANGGSNEPKDSSLYLDQALAIAQAASTAPEGKKFDHWVVQRWDKATGAYVDDNNSVTVKPGSNFTVLKTDAQIIENEGSTRDNPSFTYTVKLKAVYVDIETPTYTSIRWHSNIKDVDGDSVSITQRPDEAKSDTVLTGGFVVTDKLANDKNALQINDAVKIRPANTYVTSDAEFLGWSKNKDAREPDFLVYKDGKYCTTDGKEVTQVAADLLNEDTANDLYACWRPKFFYVYHSGAADGAVEKVKMSAAHNGYDLTQHLTANTLYGGYYSNYAGKGSYAGDGKKGSGGVKYDGMNVTWNLAEAQEASGKTLNPTAGVTYYIKEVPTYYLLPDYQYTYTVADGEIQSMFLFSAMDDLNYSGVGFVVQDEYKTVTNKIVTKVFRSFTVKTAHGGSQVTLTPSGLFAKQGLTKDTENGRLIEYRDDNLINATKFTFRPYWVTQDKVKVFGSVIRNVSMGNKTINAGGIERSDQKVGAEIQ